MAKADWLPLRYNRYLDPDPSLLVDEVNARTNPRFHSLNGAVGQLVSSG